MIESALNQIIPINLFHDAHEATLNLEAIAFFAAAGFFPENDTYWQGANWEHFNFDKQPWKYEPRDISLAEVVDEFAALFHQIVDEQTKEGKAILALSGGLDSRTLAVAMQNLGRKPHTYSYRFEGSFEETYYGREIAKALGWKFDELVIPPNYLWHKIAEAGKINGCYAEFTHARQVAVSEQLSQKGDVWLLGHWGDVLFDDMGIKSSLTFEEQVKVLYKKVLKKGGKELASDLWQTWNLPGKFEDQLHARLSKMHARIDIEDANARVRAFKSLYWATRWTSTNLNYFSHYKPMALPYYDDRMCRFAMTVPEKHLAGRQIQIEYIKKYSPQLAKIAWQAKAPYNLYNFQKHLTPAHLPYRIATKAKNVLNEKVLGKKLIQRNWEIQFLGAENDKHLRGWLFENESFAKLVPKEITEKYYRLFKTGDQVYWSHPLSMLLTLSVFAKQNNFKKP
jgi:asparagine synthetase B (glutamine-hydrolysing)